MQIDVLRRLTHRLTLQPLVGADETGSPIWDTSGSSPEGSEWVSGGWIEGSDEEPPGGGSTVRCFIEPVTRRILGENNRVIVTEYDVLVLGTVVIKAGDRVVNGIDSAGVTLITTGIIEVVDDSYHPIDGRKARLASVRTVPQ